ncbi:hypothetical protein Tco_1378920 [Tanacetum coccineum]
MLRLCQKSPELLTVEEEEVDEKLDPRGSLWRIVAILYLLILGHKFSSNMRRSRIILQFRRREILEIEHEEGALIASFTDEKPLH